MDSYREQLQTDGQKSQESYDKAILTLSGGALILSFTFIKDIIGVHNVTNLNVLLASWVLWTACILFTLTSFCTSYFAIQHAVNQIDRGEKDYEKLTNCLNCITVFLNISSGTLFVLGTLLFTYFTYQNVKEINMADHGTKKQAITENYDKRGLPVRKPPTTPVEKPKEEK